MKTALRPRLRAKHEADRRLRLVVARSADAFTRLEGPWRAWDQRGGAPSAHYGWTRACLKAFGWESDTLIAAVVGGERLSAAAALVRRVRWGVGRWFLAGTNRLGEPADLVWSDPAGLDRLSGTIVGLGPLLCERLPADSPALGALARALGRRGLLMVRPAASYPHLMLDETWMAPQQHLSARGRAELAAARRSAERLGNVAVEIHAPSLDELPALVAAALALAPGTCGTSDDALDRAVFYRQYAETASIDGTLRIGVLKIGDRVAAAALGIESGGAFWQLTAGSDASLGIARLDGLLAGEMIRYAAEAGLGSYEFWGGADTGCWDLMAVPRRCVSLAVYPLGPRGAAALVADVVVETWQSWRGVWRELAACRSVPRRLSQTQPASHAGRWPAGGSLIT